ncbi:hypothetical protein [Goodfellowiella coeruleoviolacea]|uniref:hypothetical protein n=1 Tax=Goodfellowiella coeruleoviolacea TaxID=334858 RepID=UPI0020A262AE|nr:hypothetical protein [Goodfellowiella coeruleoviolacea]
MSIWAVRRLDHASTDASQLYALLADAVADDEIRAARQCCDAHRPSGNAFSLTSQCP